MAQMEKYSFKAETKIENHPDSPGVLTGWVTKFGLLSCDRGGYRDTFTPQAFSNLGVDDIRALKDHDWDTYLGRTNNQTLELILSDEGLQFRLILPDTQDGRDTAVLCKRKDFEGCSFGYLPDQYTWSDGDDMPVREHTSGKLFEISVVYDPAFDQTEVVLSSKTPGTEEAKASLELWKQSQIVEPVRDQNRFWIDALIRIADLNHT